VVGVCASILALGPAADVYGAGQMGPDAQTLRAPAAPPPGRTILVSTGANGGFAQFGSRSGIVRADGREVFWWGELPNSNFVFGIIAFDPATGSQSYVSLGPAGTPLDADTAYGISPDGRFIAFQGRIVSPDGNVTRPVLLRDRLAGTTVPISLTPEGDAAQDARAPSVSADGRYVVFLSNDSRLDPAGGPLFGNANAFLRDVLAGTTIRISTVAFEPGVTLLARDPKISADGRWVTYSNGVIFLYDRVTGTTTIVSRSRTGANALGARPAISDDGRFVAYHSFSTDIVANDTNGANDIFVYDRESQSTIRASVGSGGLQANGGSFTPAISGDGRYVAFETSATNLQTDVADTNDSSDVFIRDLQLDAPTLVSITSSGTTPNAESFESSVSRDGSKVTFRSRGSNVLPDDTNNAQDVFVRDRSGNAVPVVSAGGETSVSPGAPFTREGRFVDDDAGQTWSAKVSYGDGPPSALELRPDKTFTLSHTYASLGAFTVEVAVSDSAGGTGRASLPVTVGNFQPRVAVGGATTLREGDSFEGSASFTDTDTGQRWTAVIDYGDGTSELLLDPSRSFPLSHIYESGLFTITVRVSDGVGDPGAASLNLTVENVAPTVTVAQNLKAYVNTSFRLEGTFTDPGQHETFEGTVDFGDGTAPEPLAIVGRTFTVSHRFMRTGSFNGLLVLRDSLGHRDVQLVTAILRRPVIFIPGILGSQLVATADQLAPIPDGHGGEKVWFIHTGDELWPAANFMSALDMDHFDRLKFKSNGRPYVEARAASVLDYDDAMAWLSEAGYTDATLRLFPYDWRFSAGSGRHVEALDALVADLMAATHADSVDIVAHSMGTMVARSYLTRGALAAHVAHAVLLGAPELGSTDALALAAYGECLPYIDHCLLPAEEVRDVFNTLPGAVDLMPSREYWRLFNGTDPLDIQHPVPYVDRRGIYPSTFEGTQSLLRASGVSDLLLASAAAFHSNDGTWLIGVTADVVFVQGVGSCTTAQLVDLYRPDLSNARVHGVDLRQIDGDYRVLADAAGPLQGARRVIMAGGHHIVGLIGSNYTNEPRNPGGVGIALNILQDRQVSSDSAGSIACVSFKLLSPAEIVVTNATGARTGSDRTSSFNEQPRASFQRVGDDKFVTVSDLGTYSATVYGTGNGDSALRVSWTMHGIVNRLAVYPLVPTTPQSIGSFSVDTAANTISELSWDINGDGVIDQRLQARVLTGAAATDQTPPAITVDPALGSRNVAGGTLISWTASDPESGIAQTHAVIDRGTASARTLDRPELVTLSAGSHVIEFIAENGSGDASVVVRPIAALGLTWIEPVGSSSLEVAAGRTLPVKFRVSDAAGTRLSQPIASIEIRDGNGAVVIGPIPPASNPSNGVAMTGGDTYHANLSTENLVRGTYELVVLFSSSTVTGEVHRLLTVR
jgi:Tol biopolymer transport system component/pimeloyl-ACP methyl ester carboxylesterase